MKKPNKDIMILVGLMALLLFMMIGLISCLVIMPERVLSQLTEPQT